MGNVVCPHCGGTGHINGNVCYTCQGAGVIYQPGG